MDGEKPMELITRGKYRKVTKLIAEIEYPASPDAVINEAVNGCHSRHRRARHLLRRRPPEVRIVALRS